METALLRKNILTLIHKSNASHIGSSLSVVEMLNAVYHFVDIDRIKRKAMDRDRVILSKGHAAAALYVVLNSHGLISDDILETYYTNGTLLGGHVSHKVPCVEHSTGALGHGLSVGVGAALGLRQKGFDSRVFVILGDGELQEGSNWEAIMLAGQLKLSNLCVLIDNNGLGGIGSTVACCDLEPLVMKFKAFNFQVNRVGGHDEAAVHTALSRFGNGVQPSVVICDTVKGKGVSFMEGKNVWHYRSPGKEDYERALTEIMETAT